MYKMSNLEIYITAFDASMSAVAAELPAELSDNLVTFDATFDTSLNMASVQNAFTFIRNGNDLTLEAQQINFAASDGVFHLIRSIYREGSVYYSMKSGDVSGSVPELVDEYLGYIAHHELGSELLVGAFDNVPQIVASLENNEGDVISTYINASLDNSFNIPQFDTNEETGDHSALWVIYSEVFNAHRDRLTAPDDGVATPLLQVGDVLVMKLVVHTPDLDSSITEFGPESGFTPSKPGPRTYKIRITIV
jgi:hypothetical protein